MNAIAWTIVGIAAGLAAMAVAAALGEWRWKRRTRELLARLEAAREPPVDAEGANAFETLPAPVRRYLRAVLPEGHPVVAAARLRHSGTFNLDESGERWVAFASEQRVLTRRPGFVWDARMPVLAGLPVRVHDAYVAGEGILQASALGLVPVARIRGADGVARDELMRYLAEAAWYPTALLPGQGVRWTALDGRTARATLSDGATSAELDFAFGEDGLVETVRSAARGRLAKGGIVPTPWEGRWSVYRRHGGVLVPERGEVAWLLPEGRHPYWRGTLTALDYEFSN